MITQRRKQQKNHFLPFLLRRTSYRYPTAASIYSGQNSTCTNKSALTRDTERANRDGPNSMQLVFDFGRLGTIRNEGSHLIQLCFVSSLNSWRIMEDELRVAGKGEGTGDVMDPALKGMRVSSVIGPEGKSSYIFSRLQLVMCTIRTGMTGQKGTKRTKFFRSS